MNLLMFFPKVAHQNRFIQTKPVKLESIVQN